MNQISLLIFDLGGVVVQNNDVVPEFAAFLGTDPRTIHARLAGSIVDLYTGAISAEEFWDRADAEFPGQPHDNLWLTLYRATRDSCVVGVLSDLKAAGYRIVAGTNTIDDHYRYHTERGDLDIFDAVYASHHMGLAKPDPAFYQYILDAESTEPERSMFFDDRNENVDAASGLGIRAYRFTDCPTLRRDLSSQIGLGTPTG